MCRGHGTSVEVRRGPRPGFREMVLGGVGRAGCWVRVGNNGDGI